MEYCCHNGRLLLRSFTLSVGNFNYNFSGHKNSLFHSHLPLQSAHKKRRSSSSAKATSGTSKGVNRMKKRSLQQASPNSDLPDSARRSQDDDDSVKAGCSDSLFLVAYYLQGHFSSKVLIV